MLTKTQIDAAVRTCKDETVLKDGAVRGQGGLQLRIRKTTAGVSAAWFAAWKKQGKRSSKQLGRYPEVSLAAARDKFRDEVAPQIASANQARVAFVQQAEDPTVENLFKGYIAHLQARGARAASNIEHVLLLGKYNAADALGRQTLAGDVTAADIRTPLADGAKRGALRTADILRTYLSAAFGWGMKSANDYTTEANYNWGIKFNPVAAVPRDLRANKTRTRNLSAEEIRVVWAASPDELAADAMRLIICCGQRVQETTKVDGCEIDLKNALWNMPPEKTKGGNLPHTIPLPRQAVEIFASLIAQHGDGPLFPARTGSKKDRMGFLAVTHAAARLEGVKKFTPRDLRRTWKSRAGDAGVDRFMRDIIQQHARNDTGSKFYDRMDYLPKMRTAMQMWEVWLDAAISDERSNVALAA